MNKKRFYYGLGIIVLILVIFTIFKDNRIQNLPIQTITPITKVEEKSIQAIAEKTTPKIPASKTSQKNQIKVGFVAGDKTYNLAVPEGSTAYEAMKILASTTSFTFKSKYYSGLGYFTEEINGTKNRDGLYWTLYINNVYSNIGASDYILKSGDKVEWRFIKL